MIELLSRNVIKILTVFSLSPGSRLTRQMLKEKTGLSNVVLNNSLNSLLNYKFIKKEGKPYSLNFENVNLKLVIELVSKQYNKLKHLPLKEYFMILDIFQKMSKIEGVENAYLFGSYSKLLFKEGSDIDIAIVSNDVKKKELTDSVRKLEGKYKKTIEVHYFTSEFYSNKRDPLVKDILNNGVKII